MPSHRHTSLRVAVPPPAPHANASSRHFPGAPEPSPTTAVDFHRFFAHFPPSSAVSQYLSSLDLDALTENLTLALTPLAAVPRGARAEAVRRRASLRAELAMLDDAFAEVERSGVRVGPLRDDLGSARVALEECLQEEELYFAPASPASPASSASPTSPSFNVPSMVSAPRSHRAGAYAPSHRSSYPSMAGAAAEFDHSTWSPAARRSSTHSASMSLNYMHAGPSQMHAMPVLVAGYAAALH